MLQASRSIAGLFYFLNFKGVTQMIETILLAVIVLMVLVGGILVYAGIKALPDTLRDLGYTSKELTIWEEPNP